MTLNAYHITHPLIYLLCLRWELWRESSFTLQRPGTLQALCRFSVYLPLQGLQQISTGCCRSVAKSCPTLCDPMDCTTQGFPVLHHLPEFLQTHVHQVSDAIQPSHSLSSPSPPALNLSQHQSFPMSQFFTSGGQSIGVSASAPVLPMNIQDWFPLGRTGWISLQSKGLSRVFSNTTVQKHQFFGAQLSL